MRLIDVAQTPYRPIAEMPVVPAVWHVADFRGVSVEVQVDELEAVPKGRPPIVGDCIEER